MGGRARACYGKAFKERSGWEENESVMGGRRKEAIAYAMLSERPIGCWNMNSPVDSN